MVENMKEVEQARLQQDQYEDEWFELQPIEKKLISYSLGLGVTLLIIFILAFKPFG